MSADWNADERNVERVIRILESTPTPAPPAAADQWLAIRIRLAAERRRRALFPLRCAQGLALSAILAAAVGLLLGSSSDSLLLMQVPQVLAPSSAAWTVDLAVKGLLLLALTIAGFVLWRFGESWIEP